MEECFKVILLHIMPERAPEKGLFLLPFLNATYIPYPLSCVAHRFLIPRLILNLTRPYNAGRLEAKDQGDQHDQHKPKYE